MNSSDSASARPRYGFLGPVSTFTHIALRAAIDPDAAEMVPCATVAEALDSVARGDLVGAMAPIENSVEGGVNGTLDALAGSHGLAIVAEVVVPVSFVLAARAPMSLEDVRVVASHSHAHAQCQGWLRSNVPGAVTLPALSTAAAAADLAQGVEVELDDDERKSLDGRAALCSPLAAETYSLAVLADGLGDNAAAVTRFVLVSRAGTVPAPTGADKTTLGIQLPDNRSGALMEMLEQFTTNGVNLSRIESRPIGDALGRYSFSIDVEGHLHEERVRDALIGLHRVCPVVRFLGSYPRFDAERADVTAHTSDAAFRAARAWVDALEQG